ncbi:hypothetical protein SESBI_23745 [Sesbania bispinosa]|nr:hypothetical protein SESBI_23745 [Sesbania bispinosa]
MIRTVFAYLNGKASHKKVKIDPLKATKAVYRDELTKKQSPSKVIVKKRVRFADSEPTILGEDHCEKKSCVGNEFGEKEGIRVKVRMTKEEAARFLSKCNGGVLEFRDVARELVSIPVNRVSVLSTCTNNL